MSYPASLQPTTTENLTLPSGRSVPFPKATPTFPLWRGEPVEDSFGRKTVLDFNGRPAFAELTILWTLESEGWRGVWVDSYRHVFRTGYWESTPLRVLPPKPDSLPQEIWDLAKIPSGVWDVFCWKGDRVLLAESKQSKKDRIRLNQLKFAEAALNTGLSLDSFLFIEWKAE